jgi:alkyl hydroperoxide reductase subunit F
LRAYAGETVEIKTGLRASSIIKNESGFITIVGDTKYESKTVLITTGSVRRKLETKGAKEFENKGITYCASCDGPLFGGADVAVIGGGNAAFETAAQLLAYAKSVTLLNRSETFRADEATVEAVLKHPNMKVLKNVELVEIKGDQFVNGISYKDTTTGKESFLPVTGIFVEIGLLPNTALVENILTLNQHKQIHIDERTQRTDVPGIWAAGDCTDGLYHQNNIAAGDAVKALEDIYLYIHTKK